MSWGVLELSLGAFILDTLARFVCVCVCVCWGEGRGVGRAVKVKAEAEVEEWKVC